jgi:hypothetical protein
LASITERALIGQEDHAVRPRIVRQRVLEREQPLGQAVGDDGFHAGLAEGAARLLVAEHVAQRHDMARQLGQVLLGVIQHRNALIEALQPLHGLPRGLVHGMADPGRDRVEPFREHAGKLGLAAA